MLTDKRRFRGVNFGENDVPDDAEARRHSGLHKDVHAVPVVKTHRQAVVFQNAEHLLARWQPPHSSLTLLAIERPRRFLKPTRYSGSVRMKSML